MEDTKDSKQSIGNLLKSENKIASNENIKIENGRYLQTLQSNFHHATFRPEQLEIIKTVIEEKRDVCAIMAGGYGKSLCFQFSAVFQNGVTLVISPIIALMQAQVLKLRKLNIPACLIGGRAQIEKYVNNRIRKNEFRVIYCRPEYLQTPKAQKFFNALNGKITLIAIDEAHVSSKYINSFIQLEDNDFY